MKPLKWVANSELGTILLAVSPNAVYIMTQQPKKGVILTFASDTKLPKHGIASIASQTKRNLNEGDRPALRISGPNAEHLVGRWAYDG